MSLKRALYSLILYLILPLVLLRLVWRSRLNSGYRQRISERLGFATIDSKQAVIWVHAVSVGETIAAKPLIEALIQNYPDHRILITTTTPTGSERVKALFTENYPDRVSHVYFPYDLPDVVSRFIRRIQPKILIVIETEIWPNLYAKCRKEKIPLLIVNARLSKKSTQSYLRIRSLVAETLENADVIAVRSNVDAEHFKQLGANGEQIKIVGNIKYDIDINEQQVNQGKQWREQWGSDRPVWVAASTHAGEDEIILRIYSALLKRLPDLVLVLVPRHLERFEAVYQQSKALEQNGINALRHTQVKNYHQNSSKPVNIIVGDTMGELQSWYASADVVFIGGSLVETGGHNPLEATALAVPVVSGPHMFNFEDITSELTSIGLLTVCESQDEIEQKLLKLLNSREKSEQIQDYQNKAKLLMLQHRGVTEQLIQLVSKLL